MINIILIITIIISIIGLILSIQTIVETRKIYYKEYLERKRKIAKEKNISNGYLSNENSSINKQENEKKLKK